MVDGIAKDGQLQGKNKGTEVGIPSSQTQKEPGQTSKANRHSTNQGGICADLDNRSMAITITKCNAATRNGVSAEN